jgi:hypothetical protein
MNLAISWATSNCDLPVTSTSILSAISLSASWNWKAAACGEYLDVLGIANLLAGVDVDKDGHSSLFSFSASPPDPKLFGQVRKHGLTGVLGFGERLKG